MHLPVMILSSGYSILHSMDSQLAYHHHHLPSLIVITKKKILARIEKTNEQFLPILGGILGGQMLTTAGDEFGKTSYRFSDVLEVTRQNLVTASFASSRVAKLRNPKQLNCGLKDYEHAWAQHPLLVNLEITYRKPFWTGCVPTSLLPEVMKVKVMLLMMKIRSGLSCLLAEEEGKTLDQEISLMKAVLLRRLDLTNDMFNSRELGQKTNCYQP